MEFYLWEIAFADTWALSPRRWVCVYKETLLALQVQEGITLQHNYSPGASISNTHNYAIFPYVEKQGFVLTTFQW